MAEGFLMSDMQRFLKQRLLMARASRKIPRVIFYKLLKTPEAKKLPVCLKIGSARIQES